MYCALSCSRQHRRSLNKQQMNSVFWGIVCFFLGAAVLFVWSVRLFDRLDSAEEERRHKASA